MQLGSGSRATRRARLSGLEYAEGIPGTVGGALFMNAGAYGGEVAGVVDGGRGRRRRRAIASTLDREARSPSPTGARICRAGFVVTAVTLPAAARTTRRRVRERLDGVRARRLASQPHGQPNAGSIFKNPRGDHAGRLIEAAGLKGWRVGGARISERHANFIVNDGRAPRGGRAGTDGDRPAGGVGAEWGMAGARGAARRQLVGRSRSSPEPRPAHVDRCRACPWRAVARLLMLAALLALAARPVLRTRPGRIRTSRSARS